MVVISASGMAEAGRILHHLIHNVEDKRNTVCIVSWQAPHTLGRRMAERQKRVRIFGEEVRRAGGDSQPSAACPRTAARRNCSNTPGLPTATGSKRSSSCTVMKGRPKC